MKIKYTNYDGCWDTKCPFCGKQQREHQVNLGTFDGTTYIHRQPCELEKKETARNSIKKANTVRVVISIYEFGLYFWNKIPFKEEISMGFRFFKRLYKGIRGWFYFVFKYGKK